MTKIQIRFYNMIKEQMVDYQEVFHKEFLIKRIEKIPDNDLKYFLEQLNIDADKFSKKGYITYAKFLHYADKFIEKEIKHIAQSKHSKIEELYKKRELMLLSIEQTAKNLEHRNSIIEDIKQKRLMFKDNNKNLLDSLDYFIIDKFGFYQFFDENRTYKIKDEIENYLFEYYKLQESSNQALLT